MNFVIDLIKDYPVASTLSAIIGFISICLNIFLYWKRSITNEKYEKSQKEYLDAQKKFLETQLKYEDLREYSRKKRQFLRWYDNSIFELIHQLGQVKPAPQRGNQTKLKRCIDSIKRLRAELIILTEDRDALNYSRALAILFDRLSKEVHYQVLFQLAKKNIPADDEVWKTPGDLLSKMIKEIEVDNFEEDDSANTAPPSTPL